MNTATQSTRGFNVIFLHSDLDDAGLTANEFRVLAHLTRRAGNGKAWPGIESIAETCKIHPDTVRKCIKELVRRKMVVVEERQGRSNLYTITPQDSWDVEVKEDHSIKTTPRKRMGGYPPETNGWAPPRNGGDEGNTVKEVQEGNKSFALEAQPVPAPEPTKPEKKPPTQGSLFVKAWFDAWQDAYGERYVVTPQDCKAAKDFFAIAEISVEDVMDMAKRAWEAKASGDNRKFFNCQRASSIMTFLKWFNSIKAELTASRPANHTAKREAELEAAFNPKLKLTSHDHRPTETN